MIGTKKHYLHDFHFSSRHLNQEEICCRSTPLRLHEPLPFNSRKCEKSVSTFYCPSLSQTSTVGKVFLCETLSQTLQKHSFQKTYLDKFSSSQKLPNYFSCQRNTSRLPKNSKQNSKSTNKVQSTSAILYFWINSVHGKQKAFKT